LYLIEPDFRLYGLVNRAWQEDGTIRRPVRPELRNDNPTTGKQAVEPAGTPDGLQRQT